MNLHKTDELVKDAAVALQYLKEGNERFVKDELCNKDTYKADREVLKGGQKPFAVIVTCSDSRVSPEIYFDQKLGDIFIIRNAGNVIDATALGSIEYAVEHLHSPLVVVVGHSSCGAVGAAMAGGELPANIKSITDRIQASVAKGGDAEQVEKQNAIDQAKAVEADELVQHCGAKVVPAYYNIHTGEVTWL